MRFDVTSMVKTAAPRTVTAARQRGPHQGRIVAVRSAEDEIARLRNVSANTFAQTAMTWVSERRDELVKAEGLRVQRRVQSMEAELAELLANSDVTKLDLMQMESRRTSAPASPVSFLRARRVKRQARAKVTERLWDWQGEYWVDEVGYYRIDTKPECPEDLAGAVGQQVTLRCSSASNLGSGVGSSRAGIANRPICRCAKKSSIVAAPRRHRTSWWRSGLGFDCHRCRPEAQQAPNDRSARDAASRHRKRPDDPRPRCPFG